MKNRIDLMINENCNIDCLFCYHHGFQDKSEYDFSEVKIKSILFFWKTRWFNELYISWWEPTISNNLEYSLNIAKQYWYTKIKIMTNGLKFSDIEYCKKLKKLWVTNLAISMHWYDEEIFEFHANVKWIYHKFIKAIINANQFFDLDINIVITKQNIKDINKHAKLLLTLWIRRVHLQHVVPNSKENLILLPSNNEIVIYINNFIESFKNKLDISLEFFPYCLIEDNSYLWRFSFKNDFVTNNSSMFDNWSEWILKNKILKDKCLKCSDKEYCNWFWI
jgi:MoaA/NifB/PqqE/SkfB family radical SAM enzyme